MYAAGHTLKLGPFSNVNLLLTYIRRNALSNSVRCSPPFRLHHLIGHLPPLMHHLPRLATSSVWAVHLKIAGAPDDAHCGDHCRVTARISALTVVCESWRIRTLPFLWDTDHTTSTSRPRCASSPLSSSPSPSPLWTPAFWHRQSTRSPRPKL